MNVMTFDVFKNTIKKHDGFIPSTAEKNYTQLLFRFKENDDWCKCSIITASFYISADNIIKSDAELLSEDLTATFSIPSEFTGQTGNIILGLQGTYVNENEETVTVATNIVTLNRNNGIIVTAGANAELYEKIISLVQLFFNNDKEQIDTFIEEVNASLANVYTKNETDTRLANKLDNTKGSVSTGNIADDAVTSAKIADEAIQESHIKNYAVTTEKIFDGAITNEKLAYESVGDDELTTELAEKINSKAKESLFLNQSSTQLIKLADIDTTINGLHITIKNNHISVKGTAESGVYSSIGIDTGISQYEANTDYTVSIQNTIDNTSANDFIGMYCSSQPIAIVDSDNFININFTEATALSLNWNIQAGTYDKEFDFQIELGTEVTPFEPYYVVGTVANNSISTEKLSEDIQENLSSINTEMPNKAEKISLLNKVSYFEFEDITSTVGVETGYYYGVFTHNAVEGFECTATPISCKEGDIFRITSATVNMDGHQGVVKCYDESQTLIATYFEASGSEIKTCTDKIFIVPEGVAYVAFNCWKHDDNLYSLTVEKAIPYTDEYGLLANTLVSSLPAFELLGKSIYSDGDSIAQGTGTGNRSYAYLLADKYNMTLTSKAVGGTTLAVHSDNGDSGSIYERVVSNITSDSQYDYIIIDGGTNDVTKAIELGSITDGVDEDFDTSTVLGALEGICKHLNTVQLTAKKLFVFVTNRVEMLKTTKETFTEMKKVLNKWGIPYIDLSNINSLGRWNDTVAEDYFADEIHPNLKAHKEFYLPPIEKALLYGGYVSSSSITTTTSNNNFIDVSEVGL